MGPDNLTHKINYHMHHAGKKKRNVLTCISLNPNGEAEEINKKILENLININTMRSIRLIIFQVKYLKMLLPKILNIYL